MGTQRILAVLVLCSSWAVLGCDDTDDDDTDESGADTEAEGAIPTCELVSTVELVDADTVAPNGRTGAELLAAIPESFETTLHWDLSSTTVEVEVLDASGQSTALTLTFLLPSSPTFYFEDREVKEASGEVIYDVNIVCDDYVRTSVDIVAETADGALVLDMAGAEVRFGVDHPEVDIWATPFVYETLPLASPSVEFVAPLVQPADSDKTIALSFEDPMVRGDITVYATESDKTHQHLVARW